MTLHDYLRQLGECMPAWLEQFNNGKAFPRQQFFASRIVYYPGSGTDGHPVKLFGSTNSAHCFVYADYGVEQNAVKTELEHPTHRFRGYQTLARLDLTELDLLPRGWTPHIDSPEVAQDRYRVVTARPFGFLEVLEREQEFDDNHAPCRLAILFLGADGIAAYDALFCQRDSVSPPFAVVVQDHGFGGNYDRFGRGGLLEHVARGCNVIPKWLLVAENSDSWDGFLRVPGVDGDAGGSLARLRFLYEHSRGASARAPSVPSHSPY